VYDVFARSLKRFRVVITIDFRLSAKKKSRVDVQNRVSSKIAFDSNFVEMRKKNEEKKERDEVDDNDERNDDIDVRIVQIAVNKQFEIQIFVIIDKRSSRFVKK
jgi:hypothetical protein